MTPTTPLSLRLEARDMRALRAIGQEVGRLGAYAAEHPDALPPRINPTKTPGNRVLHGVSADRAAAAVEERIQAVGLARDDRRDDQHVAAEIVLTVDARWAAAQPPAWRKAFYERCVQWLTRRYGAENVVSVTAHEDEAAPHVHAVVVPVTEITGRNRYGEYRRTRVSYSAVFGGSRREHQERARARREGRSAETTLGRLQTEAALAFADLGIVRGVEGSAATRRHMTRDDFYKLLAALQKGATEDVPATPPPEIYDAAQKAGGGTWEDGVRAGWTAACAAWRVHPAIADAAMAHVERDRAQKAARRAAEKAKEAREMEEKLNAEREERRRLVASLKIITATDLNAWFGDVYPLTYVDRMGRTRPVKTALDRLMHVERMDYDNAIEWLVEHCAAGGEPAAMAEIANAAAESARADAELAVQSAIDRRIVAQLKQVSAAVGAELQVFAFNPDEKDQGYELYPRGRSVNAWTAEDWAPNLALLKAKNFEGMGIYAYPAKTVTDRALILVDDVHDPQRRSREDSDAWLALAQPNLVLQTSGRKSQAVLVAPGDPRKGGPDYEVLKRVAQDENRRHGDPGVNNLRHSFRLPGFYNRKEDYKAAPPLVRLIGAPHAGPSPYILRRIAEARAAVEAEEAIKKVARRRARTQTDDGESSPSPR